MNIADLKIAIHIFQKYGEIAITIEPDYIYGGVTPPEDMPEHKILTDLDWNYDYQIGMWKYELYQPSH